ncbi:uncharacterized protein LOC116510940 [Thamnophis elegans]|uniref:uncharacterized protein LOC116510940 n=1 Tax=Thamnophis elegans TaxID=35005 RepID=UPI001378F17A|nr:uncharacterized protein LOC116510940 [Thamnophis elegans]
MPILFLSLKVEILCRLFQLLLKFVLLFLVVRKSETLEVFQALEEGLLERLDSKSLKLAKEGRLVRRRSSPALCREVKTSFPREPEQPRKREPLCIGRAEQQLKISSQSHGESLHLRSPKQQPEREIQSRRMPLYSATSTSQEREGRKLEEFVSRMSSSAERVALFPTSHGRQVDNDKKRRAEILHQKSPGKNGTDTRWKSSPGTLHTANPSNTLDKNQARPIRQLDRYKESDRKARGKPLLLIGAVDQPRKDIRNSQEVICAVGSRSEIASRGKGGQPLVCSRLGHEQSGVQEVKKYPFNPRKQMGTGLKSPSAAVNSSRPGMSASRSKRDIRNTCGQGRCIEDSGTSVRELRHSPNPGSSMESSQIRLEQARCCAASQQHLENNWKSGRETRSVRAGASSDGMSKRDHSIVFTPKKENDWKGCCTSCSPTNPTVFGQQGMIQEALAHSIKPETVPRSQESSQSHVHPIPSLEKEWLSQGECFHSAKPGQQQLGDNREHQETPVKRAEDEWINWQRCPSPSTAEKHLGNNKEKISYLVRKT